MDKKMLRKYWKEVRSVNTAKMTDKQGVEAKILSNLKLALKDSKDIDIAAFYPIQTEVDCLSLGLSLSDSLTGRLCLPVVGDTRVLSFRLFEGYASLTEGQYGEKIPDNTPLVVPQVVLVPLLAFDEERRRLGYGKGYYDNTLRELKKENPVFSVGIAFEFQKSSDPLPEGEFDEKVDCIVTEENIYV